MKTFILTVLFLISFQLMASPSHPRKDLNYRIGWDLPNKIILLQIKNSSKNNLKIDFQSATNSSIKIASKNVAVAANQELTVKLAITSFKEGQNILILTSKTDDVPEPGPEVFQPVIVHGTDVLPLTLGEMIVERQAIRANSNSALSTLNINGYIYRQPIAKKVFNLSSLPVNQIEALPYLDTGDYIIQKLKQLPDLNFDYFPGVSPNVAFPPSPITPMPNLPMAPTPSGYVVKGKMAMKLADKKFVAAWGWTVRAWQNQGPSGWSYLGGTSVRSNGDWQLGINPNSVQMGKPISIEFIALNRFFELKEPNGTPWTWNTEVNFNQTTLDIGARLADLTTEGDVPGLGEVYLGAAALWVKLAKNRINAIREAPYKITFPNKLETGKCIYGSPRYAWSCSYQENGDIYLVPEHAKKEIVIHELGHSINFYFWDGQMPSDMGGVHTLTGCGKQGMALTEGFADFLAAWVLTDTKTLSPVNTFSSNLSLEVKLNTFCYNSLSEFVVMQLLWDMIDYHKEGQYTQPLGYADTIALKHDHMPITMYLMKPQSTLADFDKDIMNWSADAQSIVGPNIHRSYVWNVSDLRP